MAETIADLKRVREELVLRRRQEVYWIAGGHHDTRIEKAVQVHLAIQAIEAVIAEGEDQPSVAAQIRSI